MRVFRGIRKVIYVQLIAVIAILFLLNGNVKAVQGYNLRCEILNINKETKEATIQVKIAATSKILGIQGTLNFDKDILELAEKSILKDGWSITGFSEETGTFLLEVSDESFYDENVYLNNDEAILELKFKIKGNSNKADISITNIKFVDADFKTIEAQECKKTININENIIFNTRNIIIILAVLVAVIIIIIIKKKCRTGVKK